MTRESFVSVVFRFLSVLYGFGSIFLAARAVASGVALALPRSIDPSLAIEPWWLAGGLLFQAIVVCSFFVAVAETSEAGADEALPRPKAARDFGTQFVESPKQAVA